MLRYNSENTKSWQRALHNTFEGPLLAAVPFGSVRLVQAVYSALRYRAHQKVHALEAFLTLQVLLVDEKTPTALRIVSFTALWFTMAADIYFRFDNCSNLVTFLKMAGLAYCWLNAPVYANRDNPYLNFQAAN